MQLKGLRVLPAGPGALVVAGSAAKLDMAFGYNVGGGGLDYSGFVDLGRHGEDRQQPQEEVELLRLLCRK